jgi:hypothetical protein
MYLLNRYITACEAEKTKDEADRGNQLTKDSALEHETQGQALSLKYEQLAKSVKRFVGVDLSSFHVLETFSSMKIKSLAPFVIFLINRIEDSKW